MLTRIVQFSIITSTTTQQLIKEKFMTYTLNAVLTTPSALEAITNESIEILSKHFNVTVTETKEAYLSGAENVQNRVNELILKSAKALVEKLNA